MSLPEHLFKKAVPVLPAYNLGNTNQFYRNRLNCKTIFYGDMLVVMMNDQEIHFYETPEDEEFRGVSCNMVVSDIEHVFAYFAGRDLIQPGQDLKEVARSLKQFSITDINGNHINFTERKS